jgi:putative peptidoglycan lipid II flippase
MQEDSSTAQASSVRHIRLFLLVFLIFQGLTTHIPAPNIPDLQAQVPHVDKVAHLAMYTILTVLLLASRLAGAKRSWSANLIVAMVLAGVIGAVDELTQPLVGRTCTLGDWAADVGGAALVGCAVLITQWRLRRGANVAEGQAGSTDGSDQGAEESSQSKFVGHAMLVSFLTLLSRFTGLARDAVIARLFGLASITDAFYLGFIIPNLFRRLFGEGALTSAFIPVYTDLLKKDKLTARRLATLCLGILVAGLGVITIVLELLLGGMLHWVQWSTDSELAIRLCMIMLPYMPLICVAALMGGILQVHGRFGPPATAPILLNLILIVAAVMAAHGMSRDTELRLTILIVAASVVAAGVVQVIWVVGAAVPLRPLAAGIRGAWPEFKKVMITMGPMVLGLAVFQINTLLDSLIAWGLAPKNGESMVTWFGNTFEAPIQNGGVTALQFAQRLYQFPLGVFGIALATAIFPALAHAAAGRVLKKDTDSDEGKNAEQASTDASGEGISGDTSGGGDTAGGPDWDRFRTILQHGLRLTMFIGLPASIGLILVR